MINIKKQLSILIFIILPLIALADQGSESDEFNMPVIKPKIKVMTMKPRISSEEEVSDPDTGYIYQGIWSDSLNPFAIKPLRLTGFDRECVVTTSSNYLEVIQFVEDSWQSISRIPFSMSHYDYYEGYSWTTGDLDKDGADEIIACHDSLVHQYKWDGKKFLTQTALFPYLIEQVRIGDINNDGDNELVFFCGESLPHDRIGYPYHLCIAKWKGSKLNMLWDDSTKLDYAVRNMPDFLILIDDVVNSGFNQLLLSRSQSDVSPTAYNLLKWNDKTGRLEFNKSFRITDKIVPSDSHIHSLPFISGRLNSLTKDNTTFLSGMMVTEGEKHSEFYYDILKIEGDSLVQARHIFHNLTSSTCFINLDGKGIGLLVIWREPPSTTNMYRFYRL
jgi:hypothetical protein